MASATPPEGMISFSLWVNNSRGINIWFSLNWSDQLCPDLNWSPRQTETPNRPCHCLVFFSCLDIVINRWMTAHCKFLMRDFEIRKGGKQSQFMAWSYSISRDPPEQPELAIHQLPHGTSPLGYEGPEHKSYFTPSPDLPRKTPWYFLLILRLWNEDLKIIQKA